MADSNKTVPAGFLFRPDDRFEIYPAPREFVLQSLSALPGLLAEHGMSIDADTQRHH
ncbi:MAG: hypothetical protein WBF99_04935 [Xanthobacteraceae bacterium]